MVNLLKVLFLAVILSSQVYGQFFPLRQHDGFIGAGAGYSWINDKPHYTVQLFPEFSFANFGVGLRLNLEIDAEGKVRNENFNEFSDYLSIIRYFRYGQKKDPFYVRLGALDYATLGHGSIMYLYNNSPSYDTRKIGLEFDLDLDRGGLEVVYGSFAEEGVVGIRTFIRPLKFTQLGKIPIIGGFEVGLTYSTDFNKNAGISSGYLNANSDEFTIVKDYGALQVFGFDFGLPILRTSIVDADVYYDYAEIVDFGNGRTAGIQLDFNGLGLVNVRTKFERRFNGPNYLPSYFNSFYELERYQYNSEKSLVKSKIQTLESGVKLDDGYYGELLVSVLNSFFIFGSYQRTDTDPKSGVVNLRTDISPVDGSFVARAGYDKINIQDEKDLFTLDDRSYLYAELGYKPSPYILVSMIYHWTFTPNRDANDNILNYTPQKKIEPRISFIYPLNY